MRSERPTDSREKIAVERIAVVVEADHDIRRRETQHSVARRDRALTLCILEQDKPGELATDHQDRAVTAAVGADQDLLGRRREGAQRQAGPPQISAAIVSRDHHGESQGQATLLKVCTSRSP